jgi:hypothetical protein
LKELGEFTSEADENLKDATEEALKHKKNIL